MVRPIDLSDFHLQAEGAEKIHQIKKVDSETEKKQFEKELAKKMRDQKGSASEDESAQPESGQEEQKKDKNKSDLDHHIDIIV